jgi:hypothetical protein
MAIKLCEFKEPMIDKYALFWKTKLSTFHQNTIYNIFFPFYPLQQVLEVSKKIGIVNMKKKIYLGIVVRLFTFFWTLQKLIK